MKVSRAARALLVFWVLAAALPLRAEDYYVAPAPTGSDSNAGTQAAPFATFQKAQSAAAAGDTVYFRAGTYMISSGTTADGVLIDKSGMSGKPIRYWAYANETPVFDFSGMTATLRITGFHVTASWIHLKGLELKGVPQNITTANESWCIYNTGGSHNIYEQLNLHHNQGPGLFLLRGGDNLVLNCDSHDNYDPKSKSGDGSNADGFGAHIGTGDTGNVFRGCRSWWNSDDGFDFIQAQEPVTVENSWAWYNGYLSGTMTPKGNGNGFKAGGYGLPATNVPATPPSHTVQTSLAFSNRAAGFYANHHPVADHWYSNTAFHNNPDYNMLGLNGDVGILRNNIAYGGTLLSNNDGIDDANNSWNLGVTVSDADFQSVSFTGVDGPRQADGSLPDLKFMKLQAGSDLIDKGKDVGLPFVGAAPDLGAFEFGAVASSAGSGGQSGQASDAGQAGGAGLGVAGGGSAGASGASAAISGSDGGTALGLAGSAVSAAGSGATIPTMTAGTFAAGGSHATAFAGTGAAGSAAAASSSGCSCSTLHGTSSTHDAAGLSLSLFMLTACVRRRRVA